MEGGDGVGGGGSLGCGGDGVVMWEKCGSLEMGERRGVMECGGFEERRGVEDLVMLCGG